MFGLVVKILLLLFDFHACGVEPKNRENQKKKKKKKKKLVLFLGRYCCGLKSLEKKQGYFCQS